MISIALAVLYSSCTISLASRCYDSVHYTPLKGLDSHDSISSWHVASANAAPNYHLIQLRSSRYGDMSLTTEVPSAAATKGASRLSARSRSTGTSVFDYGDVSPSVANILLASKVSSLYLHTPYMIHHATTTSRLSLSRCDCFLMFDVDAAFPPPHDPRAVGQPALGEAASPGSE